MAGAGRAGVDIGADAGLELVDGFCCLGGMLGVDGDADATVEAGVRVGWSGFGRLVPLLAGRDVSLVVGGGCMVVVCVRGGMLHGGGPGLLGRRAWWRFVGRGWGWSGGCVALG